LRDGGDVYLEWGGLLEEIVEEEGEETLLEGHAAAFVGEVEQAVYAGCLAHFGVELEVNPNLFPSIRGSIVHLCHSLFPEPSLKVLQSVDRLILRTGGGINEEWAVFNIDIWDCYPGFLV